MLLRHLRLGSLRLLCLVSALTTGLAHAQKLEPERPTEGAAPARYQRSRDAEDWRFACSEDHAGLDRLKCVELGGNSFASFGGDIRLTGAYLEHEFLGGAPVPSDALFASRVLVHGDFRLGTAVRLFVQPRSSLAQRWRGPLGPVDQDSLAWNAAFVDFELDSSQRGSRAALRVGRQELQLGAGRLVAYRDGPNVPLSFDGARYFVRHERIDADVFYLRELEPRPGAFDNLLGERGLFGSYLRWRPQRGWTLDAYLLGQHGQDFRGTLELRSTAGGLLRAELGSWAVESEGSYQFGRLGPLPVRAWTVVGGAEWRQRFDRTVLNVALGGAASSGDEADTTAVERFSAPYPTGRFLGSLGPGVGNMLATSLRAGLVHGPLLVSGTGWLFARESLDDGLYALPGFPLRAPGNSTERLVGGQFQVLGRWTFSSQFSTTVLWAHFVPGAFLRDVPPTTHSSTVAMLSEYRF